MTEGELDRVRRLRQSDETWLCTARRAPTWIMPDDEPPYRPYIVLVVIQESEIIRRTAIKDERPGPDVVLEELLSAMRPSLPRMIVGFGWRRRPARILLDDADLVGVLAPRLAEIGVGCEYRARLPVVDAALRDLEAHMNKRDPIPGLLSVAGATRPLVEEFFAAAAAFYRQAPWRWIDNAAPIEVRYPCDGRTRYALVLGSGRETFGLSLYESVDDLHKVFSSRDPDQPTPGVAWFSLVFEEATAMSFDDLDAMERYGWPVAGEWAYPLAIKVSPGDDFGIPSVSELMWLAATLRVLPDFLVGHLHADRGYPSRRAEATFALPEIHGGQEIALRYPVDLLGLGLSEFEEDEVTQEDDELEEFIEDWYWDEASHEFARQLGAFLFGFLDELHTTGLSERTWQKHVDNCWLIGKFVCDYGYHDTFSPAIFAGEPSYLYEFRRKVSSSKSAVDSYKATWRKLARYVQSQGYGE